MMNKTSILVAVGTTNPVKIKAVETGFKKIWPHQKWQFQSIEVDSKVSSQPMSDTESIKGARNRAKAALKALNADYGVGIEGGIQEIDKLWFDSGWCVVIDKNGQEGIASSAKVPVPKMMMKMIKKGMELGDVLNAVFNETNLKQKEGHFGRLTDNAVTRTDGYVHGVCLALSRFLHPELFRE